MAAGAGGGDRAAAAAAGQGSDGNAAAGAALARGLRANWEAFWAAAARDHCHAGLVWNERTRSELREALQVRARTSSGTSASQVPVCLQGPAPVSLCGFRGLQHSLWECASRRVREGMLEGDDGAWVHSPACAPS